MHGWREHTGELELELVADDEQGIFAEALAAISELLSGLEPEAEPGVSEQAAPGQARVRRDIELEAPDAASLLADWVAELAFLAEAEALVPLRLLSVSRTAGSPGAGGQDGQLERLRARIEARRGRPPPLIKGATYHRLELAGSERGWRARVVLDV